jgi:hypothetical protein
VLYSVFWGNATGVNGPNVTLGEGCITAVEPLFATTYMYLSPNCPAAIRTGAADLRAVAKFGFDTVQGDNKTFTDLSKRSHDAAASRVIGSGTSMDSDTPFGVSGDNSVRIVQSSGANYFTLASPGTMNLSTNGGAWTVEGWIKPETAPASLAYLYGTNSGASVIELDMDANRHAYAKVNLRGNGWVYLTGSSVLSLNQWSHLALVMDGTYLYLYVNGAQEAQSSSYSYSLPSTMNQMLMGYNGSYFFNGRINDVRISNVNLSPSQLGYGASFSDGHYYYIGARPVQ